MKSYIFPILFISVFILHESYGKDEERDMDGHDMHELDWMHVEEHMIQYAVVHKKADYKKAAYYCMHYGGKLLTVPHAKKVMKYIHDYLYHMSHGTDEHGRSDNAQSRKMMMDMHKYYHKLRIDAATSWTDSMGYPAPVEEEFGDMYNKYMSSLALCPSIMRVKTTHPKAKLYFVCEKDMYSDMMETTMMPYETTMQEPCQIVSLSYLIIPPGSACPSNTLLAGFVNTVSQYDYSVACCPIAAAGSLTEGSSVNSGGSGFHTCDNEVTSFIHLNAKTDCVSYTINGSETTAKNCYPKRAPFGTDVQCDERNEYVQQLCLFNCDPMNNHPGNDIFFECCEYSV